jgi:hypothetical protein
MWSFDEVIFNETAAAYYNYSNKDQNSFEVDDGNFV